MDDAGKKFLYELLTTPAPTGNELQVQSLLSKRLGPVAERCNSDVHGNLYLGLNTKAKRRVILAGHCHQIGFLVTEVGQGRFLYVEPLGGIHERVVQGSQV